MSWADLWALPCLFFLVLLLGVARTERKGRGHLEAALLLARLEQQDGEGAE